jgi:transcriptional regulator of heat shock response
VVDDHATRLLNIFMQSAEDVLDPTGQAGAELLLGRTSVLANQPEFSSGPRLRSLIELTEQPELLTGVLAAREHHRRRASRSVANTASRKLSTLDADHVGVRIGNLSGRAGRDRADADAVREGGGHRRIHSNPHERAGRTGRR